jgi:type I restriction enzyme M protein
MNDVVQRFWSFCHTLRHDGIDYGEYIEQITYLLFLKMADERRIDLSRIGSGDERIDGSWPRLATLSGSELLDHYVAVLAALGREEGLLSAIFADAVSRFNKAANLKRLIDLIDETEWTALEVDIKAAVFEGLLEKAASEGKKGAGQYFTPRLLIQSIVRCVRPDPRVHPELTLCDPACGTGGFLVVAYEWFREETRGQVLPPDLLERVRRRTYFGQELVERPRRLALMNLYLHNLAPEIHRGDSIYEPPDLATLRRFDVVLTNPPFGSKGANQAPSRPDFAVTSSNKQLNFLQHVLTLLKPGGRAAVIVPDNCLFADQAGPVFEILTAECDLHTVLRLPNGTFTPYSAGTKTNVVFFTKGRATETVWVYDARTNVSRVTKKDRPLTADHLAAFEACYGPDPDGRAPRSPEDSAEDRWRSFPMSEVRARDYKIDGLKWLQDHAPDGDLLPEPEELAGGLATEIEGMLEDVAALFDLLEESKVRRPRAVARRR